ncbi:TIGR03617 family F420-dependent LLM class oxidoreductase [Rhodopila sp.]|jgi:probable F420-dependent oxidoreductase|uniref:TIGR03617 family F420-dependent LLM class oxidoreductase n=1 Tax=Rhodopila sp. TaxID=2480087 RepID=UPI002B97188B|nr:TIGR03617 family F420-dependent LLM class oxidoreductase [Rhodopila sp.]HVZ09683.1 TIGR03617 family F420-dependent LLM class oxidoreductase [Rhodopila sp.]
MRVFTSLPQRHWREVAPAARAAEAAGFDAVMTVELGHDPLTPLAVAGLATQRLELTPSVAVAFPRSPTVLAQQAWDIHANSGGRFVLGLGSQVKGHNERRFGIAWTAPAPRMRDYVRALHAVWTAWETRGRLNFDSPHYKLSLMTPDFSPEPTGLPMPAVTIAAVGEAMLRVAGQVGDGVRLHPLCSRAYLEQVCLPQMMEGMRRSGRSRLHFDVHGGGFVCTGPDEATVAAEVEKARRRIGFYGSTRTYLPILALHGLEDLSARLHRMSVEGQWDKMAAEVSDEVVGIFAARGTYAELPKAVEARFGGLADSIDVHFPPETPAGLAREVVADIRRIPHTFAGFNTNW